MSNFDGKKCVIYTRVSSKTQIQQGNWLQSQETLCKEWAKRHNVEVVQCFSDGGISGKFDSREGLDTMIDFLISQNHFFINIDFVLADDLDRISRDVAGWINIKNKIEKEWKAWIQTVKQTISNSAEWIFNQNIIMAVKQYERENNARRVKDRKRWRMLDWYWVFPAPSGYQYEWKWALKKLVPNSDSKYIQNALELYANWWFKNDTEFWYYLNDQMPHFAVKTAEKLLTEERLLFYAGLITYPKYWIDSIQWKHQPIISVDTVIKIQNRKGKKVFYKTASKEDINENLPLRHYLICPECKKAYSWWPSYNKNHNIYYYYRCINPKCRNNTSLNARLVHHDFWEILKNLTIKESALTCFKIILEELFNSEKKFLISKNNQNQSEIQEIDEQINKLEASISNSQDNLFQEIYQKKITELRQRKNLLLKNRDTDLFYQKNELNSMLDFVLPILKSPYKLRSSNDPEIMQIVPGVVLNTTFLYSKKVAFTTPKDASIYATFNAIFWSKSPSLEVRRIELRSKRHNARTLPL